MGRSGVQQGRGVQETRTARQEKIDKQGGGWVKDEWTVMGYECRPDKGLIEKV